MFKTNNRRLNSFLIFLIIPIIVSCIEDQDFSATKENNPSLFLENHKIERFEISIDTRNPSLQGITQTIEKQMGVVMLPKGYSSKGKPTKLIIYCHSGSGTVTEISSEAENDNFCRYFVSLGYAVMDVAAIPRTYSERLKIDYGRTVGSYIALRSYIEGYNYVIKNYNIDNTGCYTFANSNGGLISLNLGNHTPIPINAQAGICPLLSIELNAWYIPTGAMTGGEFSSYQNRANIIRIYGMQNVLSQTQLNDAKYEKEKVGKYDPYDYTVNQTDKPYPIPFIIFQPKDDPVVYHKIAETLVSVNNKRGGNMILRSFEKGGHTPAPIKDTLGYYTYMKKLYPTNTTNVEAASWFEDFGGNSVFFYIR